jgi:type VI secretion system protein VasG
MGLTNLKSLVAKLNTITRRALEGAAGLCVSRTNYNVELEHWLLKLAETGDGDLARIFKNYGLDRGRVSRDLTRSLDGLKTGNVRKPELSPEVIDLMREAWSLASVEYGESKVRSGYLLVAILGDRSLALRVRDSCPELGKIPAEQLIRDVQGLISPTTEDEVGSGEPSSSPSGEGGRPLVDSKTRSLDQYTYNLTAQAQSGQLDPVIGRDTEIAQLIDILTRRRQNNPILTGEAGVGKTAVVEGLAIRIVAGDVPKPLRGVQLRVLDLALLQAGAGVKGEFENRLKAVIQEVKSSPVSIILFIDEAHTLVGAGGSVGQGDAANLLKPALARGELRTIAATTRMEYKKYFESDPALKRRFQEVKIDEPTLALAIRMLRGLSAMLERHHHVRILDEAVTEAVRLSHRYLTDRQLPDKSISLLDTACAKVALSQSATPWQITLCRREIEYAQAEIHTLELEQVAGGSHETRLEELRQIQADAKLRLKSLETRLASELSLVEEIRTLRTRLESNLAGVGKQQFDSSDVGATNVDLATKTKALGELQGEDPLVHPLVTAQAVAEVVSGWTGIPVGKMVRNEIDSIMRLSDRLGERVIGQSHALRAVTQRIQTARAGLGDPRRPLGVFLLVGPSGVGKTETAVTLAEILYGGDRNLITINMSEYKEDHKISRLTGSAPGYVGYGEGGILTEAVRRKPHSVVLLDEVEKANESVQEIFYQVFDKGVLLDDRGNEINFKNTIILLTSNIGTDRIMKITADPDTSPDAEGLAAAIRPELLKVFKPALLGRMTVVPYYPLTDTILKEIIQIQLKRIGERVHLNHRAVFSYDPALVEMIASRCKEVESGARNVDHILTDTLLPELSREFLGRMAEGRPVTAAHVTVDEVSRFRYLVS